MRTATQAALILAFTALPVGAQRLPDQGQGILSLELLKPRLNSDAEEPLNHLEASYLTFAAVISADYRISEAFSLSVELPFSHLSGRANACIDAVCMRWVHGTVLNNPYLGFAWSPGVLGLSLSAGVRPPLQKASWLKDNDWEERWEAEATAVGVLGDRVDRLEMYLPDVSSFTVRVDVEGALSEALSLGLFFRPVAMYHPDGEGYLHDRDGEKTEVHFHFGGWARVARPPWMGSAGVTARRYHTALHFEDKNFWEGQGELGYRFGSTEVRGEIHVPFGNRFARDYVVWSGVLGLSYYLN